MKHREKLLFKISLLFFLCMYVCLAFVHVSAESLEARRGRQILWSWSYKLFWDVWTNQLSTHNTLPPISLVKENLEFLFWGEAIVNYIFMNLSWINIWLDIWLLFFHCHTEMRKGLLWGRCLMLSILKGNWRLGDTKWRFFGKTKWATNGYRQVFVIISFY